MTKLRFLATLFAILFTLPLVFCSCGECEHIWDAGFVAKEATHEAEGYRIRTCTECGEQRAEAIAKLPHKAKDHTYDKSLWGNDDTYHWLICDYDDCGATTGKAPHTLTASTNGGYICQLCRNEVSTHAFTNKLASNEQLHWMQCDDADCPAVAFKEPHKFTDNILVDSNHHWLQCDKEGCLATSQPAEHTWVENEQGQLICSYCMVSKPQD